LGLKDPIHRGQDESLVPSILLYCAETWSMKKANEKTSLKQLIIDAAVVFCPMAGFHLH